MVFSTTALFKGTPCPEGDKCTLTNCIFRHESQAEQQNSFTASNPAHPEAEQPRPAADRSTEPMSKRRKITYDSLADKPPSRADLIRTKLASARTGNSDGQEPGRAAVSQNSANSQKPQSSLTKPISPPPKPQTNGKVTLPHKTNSADGISGKAQATPIHRKGEKVESLNPRLIPDDPAGHQKRLLFLKYLHAEMLRLHGKVNETAGLSYGALCAFTEQKITTLALDEEEKIAREQSSVYANVVKQRIAALKKISAEDWVKYINTRYSVEAPKSKKAEKPIETGLALEQEYLILPQLVADQAPLGAFGYILKPPSKEEAAEAAAAVELSKNYEVCDRCSGRFQVFPDRNAEGQLTSNGPCFFHPCRKQFPQRSKADREMAPREPFYPCCSETVGATGCTRHDEHVFKSSSPARLAAILPFVNTPENPTPATDRRGNEVKAVTFDCEMGYTVYGMELIRLTAVSWPCGEQLLDILVRPLGAVIDFNSRFSGVFPESFQEAIPYDTWDAQWRSSASPPPCEEGSKKRLPVVDNPQRARKLLCSFIKPTTPLIGHAIDNDLNTVRLCHPTIIDTIILYPHPKGLPMRFGLKMLAQRHLSRYIQTGGDQGHDSLEDAVATGDLVRIKVGERWKYLRASGWQIIGDQLVPPAPLKQGASTEAHAKVVVDGSLEQGTGKKRKQRPWMDGADDGEEGVGVEGGVEEGHENQEATKLVAGAD